MTDPYADARKRLFTAVLSDTLDSIGLRHQALPPSIRPLDEDLVMVGRARTGVYQPVYHVAEGENPYELEIALIDDLKPHDVAVLSCGGSSRIAPWGELLTNASIGRKAAGCLTDGLVRDIKGIRDLKFPVFHGGIGPLDSKGRGKVAAIDVPVEIGGVAIMSGDLIFGDCDGVVVIPTDKVDAVFAAAYEKLKGEDQTRVELRAGLSLREVFERHGVL